MLFMPKENEIVTVSVLREMFAENNAILMKRMDQMDERFDRMDTEFARVHAKFDQIDAQFEQVHAKFAQIDTEFARVHREIGDLRNDVMDFIDRSIVPQLEEHRRDISLLKRAVTTA